MSAIGRNPVHPTKEAVDQQNAVIANGTSTTGNIDLRGKALTGILMPAAWTAASLTFDVSRDGTNFFPLHDRTAAYVIAAAGGAAAGLAITMDPEVFGDWTHVRIRSGVIGTYVNQGAARTLVVLTRDV